MIKKLRLILNQMVKYSSGRLDQTFAALADPTRRRMLEQLAPGRTLRDRHGQAAFHVAPRHFEAFARAGKGRTTPASALRTCSSIAIGGKAAEAGRAVGGRISQVLGRIARSPGRVFGKDSQANRQERKN